MKPSPTPNTQIHSFHAAVRGWKRLNSGWKRHRPECSQYHIIRALLSFSMHDCPFLYLPPLRPFLLRCSMLMLPSLCVCLSFCKGSLIDADQVLYTCAYLYWTLQWAEGTGGRIFSSLWEARFLYLSPSLSLRHTHTHNERHSQITPPPHPPAVPQSLLL